MAETLEHLLFEGSAFGSDIVAVIDYYVEPASGDGWDEPRDPGGPSIASVKLVKVTRSLKPVPFGTKPEKHESVETREDIGEAPAWVLDVLDQQEWHDAIPFDEPDEDAWRDRMSAAADIDREYRS